MAAPRKRKPPQTYPLNLNAGERESLLLYCRLRPGIERKIKEARKDSRAVEFTLKDLEDMVEELESSLRYAFDPHEKRLNAVLDKVEELLAAVGGVPEEPVGESGVASDVIYQFKVTLKDIKPPIWRRFQVRDCTLGELHEVLQIVMGWDDEHLHNFIVRGKSYGPQGFDDLDFFGDDSDEDEEEILISEIAAKMRKVRFKYEYDFGDSWEHEIVLERRLKAEPDVEYPRCFDGARACPPENIGGVWGYYNLLEAIAGPDQARNEFVEDIVEGGYNPEAFSVDALNLELRDSG